MLKRLRINLWNTLFPICLVVSACITCISCTSQENQPDTINQAFHDLYMANGAKDYPRSEKALKRCQEFKYQVCLDLYNQVVKARDYLLSLPLDGSLDQIFNLIEQKKCNTPEEQDNFIATCYGALMFLVIYDSKEQDAEVLSRAKKLSPQALAFLLSVPYFSWVDNRPDRDLWVKLANTKNIPWPNEFAKSKFLNAVGKNTQKSTFWLSKNSF